MATQQSRAQILLIGVWISRILLPICILIILYLFKQELSKRKHDVKIENDPYPKWLNFWSSLTFIFTMIFLSIWTLHRIPTICLYSYGLMISTWGTPGACITMYQITRLQYCFSVKQVHSDKYGYPKWIFIILYTNFFVLAIYFYTVSWFVYSSWPSKHFDGCEGNTNEYMYIAHIAMIWFWIWDLVTLSLYAMKIKQIKRDTEFKSNLVVFKKIKFTLHKILLLTIIYELKLFFVGGISFIFGPYQIISILSPLLNAMDGLMSVGIMYLMIEHNNEQYVKFIKVLCCCNGVRNTFIDPEGDKEESLSIAMFCCILNQNVDRIESESKSNKENSRTTTSDLYPNGKSVTNHKTAMNTKTLGEINLSNLNRYDSDPLANEHAKNKHKDMEIGDVIHAKQSSNYGTETRTEDLYPNGKCKRVNISTSINTPMEILNRNISATGTITKMNTLSYPTTNEHAKNRIVNGKQHKDMEVGDVIHARQSSNFETETRTEDLYPNGKGKRMNLSTSMNMQMEVLNRNVSGTGTITKMDTFNSMNRNVSDPMQILVCHKSANETHMRTGGVNSKMDVNIEMEDEDLYI